ncbi:MAG: hypothetical protein JNM64_18955 [Chloroflexia bacterium]|nr:hypothetical protein [Chloroflexia bacterium]
MSQKPRLGCLHAHHSNIGYIEDIIPHDALEAVHFVEPGLLRRIGSDATFSPEDASDQVRKQLDWMTACGVDAVLITCTNYIAAMPDEATRHDIPIIKIDEPFFTHLLQQPPRHLLLFSNPDTVAGTMQRLHDYAAARGQEPEINVEVIPNTFSLFLTGQTEAYNRAIAERLRELVRLNRFTSLSVGQLSMVNAAQRVAEETGHAIGNPLQPLRAHLDAILAVNARG